MGFVDIVYNKPQVIAKETLLGNKIKILLNPEEQPPKEYGYVYLCTLTSKRKQPFILDAKAVAEEMQEKNQLQFIRWLKQTKPFAIMNLEWSKKKDFLHQRRSGMNHVLFQAMKELNIAYLLSYQHFTQQTIPQEVMLGRIMQNIILARKAKVRVIYASLAQWPEEVKAKKDIEAVLRLLGMSSQQIKEALLYE